MVKGGVCGKGGMCGKGRHAWQKGGHAWQRGSVHGEGGACVVKGVCVWDMTRYGDTINERAVRILLECILVSVADLEG